MSASGHRAPDEIESAVRPAGVTSSGLLGIPHLSGFLLRPVVRLAREPVGIVAGWGSRRSGAEARREARRRGVPAAILEDGFLRSVGIGKSGAPPLSLAVDDRAPYYESGDANLLEELLNSEAWRTEEFLQRAARCLEVWRRERLSKYNVGAPCAEDSSRTVILVDQVVGDLSVTGAGATGRTFDRMLDWALERYDAERLRVRTHPDVVAGRASGYLTARALRLGIRLSPDHLSPPAALDGAEHVLTVSSQFGFEALLRGVPVTNFGTPFYAGYGATEDLGTGALADSARRRRSCERSVLEIFGVSCLEYARYADPISLQPLSFERAVDRLIDWRDRDRANAGWTTACYGVSRRKRATATRLLGGSASRMMFASLLSRDPMALPAEGPLRVAVWGVRDHGRVEARARRMSLDTIRVEDGFIRSVGLGSAFLPASSWIVDDQGIYYDADHPNRLESLLEAGGMSSDVIARAAVLRTQIIESQVTKYNLKTADLDLRSLANGRPIMLVVEQVPGDAALRLGAGTVRTNAQLLTAVRASAPEAFVVYKEHPDLVSGLRRGRAAHRQLSAADLIVSKGDLADLYRQVDAVHTISSLAGFEALLRGVRVVVWGKPFYAGWGLTEDRESFARRTRGASLDELVAAALILYPRYADARSGVPCAVEDIVRQLSGLRGQAVADTGSRGRDA